MANIIKIADFSDGALDFYAREKEAQLKHRPAHGRGMFIAESPIVIERALAAGYEMCIRDRFYIFRFATGFLFFLHFAVY